MHPIFHSRTALLAYVAAWIPIFLQTAFTLKAAGTLSGTESFVVTASLIVALSLVCLWSWNLCRLWPLRSTSPLKVIGGFLLASLLVNALVVGWVRLTLYLASPWLSPTLPVRLRGAGPAMASTVFLVFLLSVAMHYTMLSLEQSKQAELLSREAELRALKAQINPHFLFNSLNSISALATAEPSRAREMCIKLSDFLRVSLRLGDRLTIPLSEEWALARTYLEVEQVRFGQRLRVAQTMQCGCEDYLVPPLLVQPLVENAIKHGIATLIEGGEVVVSSTLHDACLQVKVQNPFDPDAPQMRSGGLGLINVRNRLQARYGPAAKMDIQVKEGSYQVTLQLPREPKQS